jgi:hypothetical protein
LNLDGVDDAALFSSIALTQFTVTAWIRANTQGNSVTPRILTMPGYNIRIRRDTASTTNAVALESRRSGTDGEWCTPGNVVSDWTWYHIAVTYDSSSTNNTPVFYVNGLAQPSATLTAPTGTPIPNSGTGYIGNSAALDGSWDGQIDEVRLYNRLLSAAELQLIAFGPATNLAPVVDAGAALIIPLGDTATLRGKITDDARREPPGVLVLHWSKISGPGEVGFDDPTALESTASFSEPGNYLLRLRAEAGQVSAADDVTVTVMAPATVSIQAVDDTAAEFGEPPTLSSPGVFTLSRVGDTSTVLITYLAIGGTASNGVDYLALTNVVMFPANARSVQLSVIPVRDELPEGEETVQVTVLPHAGYLVGSPSSDTVYLRDAPWDEWRFVKFSAAERRDPNLSGAMADADHDGIVNLLEYALDLDPKRADANPGFHGTLQMIHDADGAEEAYVLTFHRRLAPTDLIYEIETSTNLSTWVGGTNVARELFPRLSDGNGVTETSRMLLLGPRGQPGPRLVRLKVRLAP